MRPSRSSCPVARAAYLSDSASASDFGSWLKNEIPFPRHFWRPLALPTGSIGGVVTNCASVVRAICAPLALFHRALCGRLRVALLFHVAAPFSEEACNSPPPPRIYRLGRQLVVEPGLAVMSFRVCVHPPRRRLHRRSIRPPLHVQLLYARLQRGIIQRRVVRLGCRLRSAGRSL